MTQALVLLSGGQDSTTCLYWATQEFDEVYTVSFEYGQRHMQQEIRAASHVSQMSRARLHLVLPLQVVSVIGNSALVGKGDVNEKGANGLPLSFVPGRNILFLTVATMWAYKLGIHYLVGGMCQTDYSGYPDCRREFVDKMQETLSEGMSYPIAIHTPLMWLTKAQTVNMAHMLKGCWEALAYTHTCYEGKFPPCGKCPACQLRAKGFKEAGYDDPLLVRYATILQH